MIQNEIDKIKKRLLRLIKEKALFYQPVKLSSGKESSYYIDARRITLSEEGAYLVARVILDLIKEDNIEAIGGPTLGADPIVGALLCLGHLNKLSLQGFIVRRDPKKHGMQRYIEGPSLKGGMRVAIVDDVVTTGKSILKAAQLVKEMDCKVIRVIALVDRMEGGREFLEKQGLKLTSVFTRQDLDIHI